MGYQVCRLIDQRIRISSKVNQLGEICTDDTTGPSFTLICVEQPLHLNKVCECHHWDHDRPVPPGSFLSRQGQADSNPSLKNPS